MIRSAIIGCGGISAVHAKVLHGFEDVQPVGCADIIPSRARERAAYLGCNAYGSMEELLDREHPDVVHLCTPHYLHPVMALEAAKRGIAVFTEKPPAIDEEGWHKIHEAAKLVPLGICFQNRYNPPVRRCMELLQTKAFGGLKGIRAFVTWHRDARYYESADWKGKWATEGGGALINQAVHTLDLVVRLLGCPDVIEGHFANHHLKNVIEVDDTVEIYLESRHIPALLYATTAYSADMPVVVELDLESATLRLVQDTLDIITEKGTQHLSFKSDVQLGRSYWGSGHTVCIRDFYDSLTEKRAYQNDAASCEDTMKALLGLYGTVPHDRAL